MHVGPRNNDSQRDAMTIHMQMDLASASAPVGRIAAKPFNR